MRRCSTVDAALSANHFALVRQQAPGRTRVGSFRPAMGLNVHGYFCVVQIQEVLVEGQESTSWRGVSVGMNNDARELMGS